MPQLRETQSWFYIPKRSVLAWCVALILLGLSLVYAWQWPINRNRDAEQRLAVFAQRLETSHKTSTELMARIRQALEAKGSSVEASAKMVESIANQIPKQKPVLAADLDTQAIDQADKYAKAQSIIETSPYKGLVSKDVPATAEGTAYRKALQVQAPLPLRYLRLEAASSDAVNVLNQAVATQALAERMWSRMADKETQPFVGEVDQSIQSRSPEVDPIATLSKPGASNEEILAAALSLGAAPAPVVNPFDSQKANELRQAREAERERQRQAAEVRRKEQEARRQELAEKLAADRERQQKIQETQRQQNAAIEQARQDKQRECMSNVIARMSCIAAGINPKTGLKN